MTETSVITGGEGSQGWIRLLVNECPEVFDKALARVPDLPTDLRLTEPTKWMSPLRTDCQGAYKEYKLGAFSRWLGSGLDKKLITSFWPSAGPRWDALGRKGAYPLLIEAKARRAEIRSSPKAVRQSSQELIATSLEKTQVFLNATSRWGLRYYQYTNRLAHLYFLRELNRIPAYLVFLYFLNDHHPDAVSTKHEWQGEIAQARQFLGLAQHHPLSKYVVDVFINVGDIAVAAAKQGWTAGLT
jgi:hypothetical protein